MPVYFQSIYHCIRQKEGFLKPEISQELQDLRAGALDFGIQAHKNLKLKIETLYLAVHLFDLTISGKTVNSTYYNQILTACLFTAGKIEEIYPPNVRHYASQISLRKE